MRPTLLALASLASLRRLLERVPAPPPATPGHRRVGRARALRRAGRVRERRARAERRSRRERVAGEGKAMGTHLAFAAYTTPTIDEAAVRRAFDAADGRDRAHRDADDDVATRQRGVARERGRRQGARSKSAEETFDVIRESLHASADLARAPSTSRSRRCTASGSSTRTSTRTRRRGRAGQGAPAARRLSPRPPRRRRRGGSARSILDKAGVKHRPRRHRQGLRRRSRVEGAPRRGAARRSTCRPAVTSTRPAPNPTGRRGPAGIRDPRGPEGDLLRDAARQRSRLQHRRGLRAELRGRRQALPPHHRPAHRASPRRRAAA